MKTRIITIAAISAFALSPAAFASDKFEFEFDFSPVEISSETGAKEVYEELEEMIEENCEPVELKMRLQHRAATQQCIDNTIEQTVADLDQPELTAVHEAQRG